MQKGIEALATAVALASTALLSACSGGGSTSTPGTGTFSAALTDAPACGYDHVYVTVASVGVNSQLDGSGSWTDITLPTPRKIDLLSLSNGALESLGQTPLAAGTYQQLRLVLVPNVNGAATLNNSVVPSGQTSESPLTTPSAAQSGLKVNTRGPFTVQAGTLVDVVLDFNACRSIVTTGRGKGASTGGASGYLLKPVITATTEVVSGAIDGYVDPADATTTTAGSTTPGATVYAEQNGVVVAGAVADANGHFNLSPLEQSSTAGTYDIVIVNAGKAADVIQSVPVVAQATTSLSTSTSPLVLALSTTGDVSGTVTASATNQPTAASVVATQTINGSLIETIDLGNSDATTGAYDFTLPVAAPQVAAYSSTLPLSFTAASTGAGTYRLTAVTDTGASASAPATVTASTTTTVNLNP